MYVNIDIVVENEYEMVYMDNVLWYLENSPSFPEFEKGDLSLMMRLPLEQNAVTNLKLFEYPDKISFHANFDIEDYPDDIVECRYDFYAYTDNKAQYPYLLFENANISLVKNRGAINNLGNSTAKVTEATIHKLWSVSYQYSFIE